jgi:hypothetical protein
MTTAQFLAVVIPALMMTCPTAAISGSDPMSLEAGRHAGVTLPLDAFHSSPIHSGLTVLRAEVDQQATEIQSLQQQVTVLHHNNGNLERASTRWHGKNEPGLEITAKQDGEAITDPASQGSGRQNMRVGITPKGIARV